MSDIMRPMPYDHLLNWVLEEYGKNKIVVETQDDDFLFDDFEEEMVEEENDVLNVVDFLNLGEEE